jgi:hypothetical protein
MNKLIYSSIAAAMLASAAFGQIQYDVIQVPGCIPFVQGTGGYGDNCYRSGLDHMAPNTCYTMNPARAPAPKDINNNAADTWWWKTTACTLKDSSVARAGTFTLQPRCIRFHQGTGGYNNHCYSSGLLNMNGKCYTMNPARGTTAPQNINNDASQTWWWVETACNDTIPVIQNNECTNPNDPACLQACLVDPNFDQVCESVICGAQPGNSVCENACSVDFNSVGCQAFCSDPVNAASATCGQAACRADINETICVDYCAANSDPLCQQQVNPTTRPDECVTDPNGPVCQAFCATNSTDGACDPNFCVNNPNDPNCFDKCINFVNGAGKYRQHCYKSGLDHMQPGKCYKPNPARGDEVPKTGHMNHDASNSWWWVQTDCEKEFITPRNPGSWSLGPDKCVHFNNGDGHYADYCYSSGLRNMVAGKCYEVNPARVSDGSAPVHGHINEEADNTWWWVETLCQDTLPARPAHPAPVFEGKVAPKAAPTLGEAEISVDNTTLSVTSTVADAKMLRVFDMNGKLLHSESFNGMAKDVDFAKFAGKGVLLVRITSGNKLVAMKKVSIR